MTAKELVLEGFGRVFINPINIKETDYETVDLTGSSLKHKMIGKGRSVYMTPEGIEVPNSQVCKKLEVEGEEIIAPKFSQTKEVIKDNLQVIDDGSIIYRAIERKFYNVNTEHQNIKDLILKDNKTLMFPFCAGNGWKLWNAALTNWNGKLLMVCCRGDLQKELEKYNEDTVEMEIELIPQQQNMKKLIKAMMM